MAGFNVGALPYFIQYQGELQQQAQRQQAAEFARQQQQQDLVTFQQTQEDRARLARQQANIAQGYPQFLPGGQFGPQIAPPPPQQAPAPGQPSQPMQQPAPQGGVPLPGQGGPSDQVVRPPLPPGGIPAVAGQGPQQPLPPFRPMPTTPPQSVQPQGQIAAPSAQAQAQAAASPVSPDDDRMEGGFSLSNIIKSGQQAGLTGTDLYDYVQGMEPYMTAQQKQRSEQFKTQLELKKLDAEIALHNAMANNQNLNREERERHDRAIEEKSAQREARLAAGSGGGGTGAADTALTEGQPLPNPAWESNAQAIAKGLLPPISPSSRVKGAQETMARVFQLSPDYDAKDYGTHASAQKYWASGAGGRQVNAINTAFSHLGNLQATAVELKNGGVPAWNAFANRIARGAGQPAPTNFEAQKEVVGDEVVKAMVGAGGGTLEDRKAIKEILDGAAAPDQMSGAMDKLRDLLAGKLESTETQYKKGTGKDDFQDYLNPEVRSYLPQGGKKGAPAAAAGGGGEATKVLNGVTYVQRNGKWYTQ
jgi:hypothetical protein